MASKTVASAVANASVTALFRSRAAGRTGDPLSSACLDSFVCRLTIAAAGRAVSEAAFEPFVLLPGEHSAVHSAVSAAAEAEPEAAG